MKKDGLTFLLFTKSEVSSIPFKGKVNPLEILRIVKSEGFPELQQFFLYRLFAFTLPIVSSGCQAHRQSSLSLIDIPAILFSISNEWTVQFVE